MSQVIGYLRVSTSHQELQKNKTAILDLADRKNFAMPKWVEEKVSSRVPWKERKLGEVIVKLGKGDKILISEMSRLGRSMLEIMTILHTCVEKGVEIYTVKGEWSLDNTIQSKVMAMAFSIAAEIERDLISRRTKEGLKYAREVKGKTLGRPAGKSKLDDKREKIEQMLGDGVRQQHIATIVGCTGSTLSLWLKKQEINVRKLRKAGLKKALKKAQLEERE